MRLLAPQRRALRDRGLRRQVALQRRDDVADEAGRRPAGEHDHPARLARAHELLGGDPVARGEHDAERRQHAIEARVSKRQRLGVTLDPLDAHPRQRLAPAGGREQLRGEIEPDDLRARRGGVDRGVAGPGGDVEHPLPDCIAAASATTAPTPQNSSAITS